MGIEMILTKKDIRAWEESSFTPISKEQEEAILERFGTEPEPYECSEQDIGVQVRNFLNCGEFEKSIQKGGERTPLPPGVEF